MNELVITMNSLAERWAGGMWAVLWQSAILAALVYVTTRCLRRAPAALRFWLWMLVALRLLVMPLASVSLPVLPATPVAIAHESVPETAITAPATEITATVHTVADEGVGAVEPVSTPAAAMTAPEPVSHIVRPAVRTWLMGVWVMGILFFCVRFAWGWRRMHRIVHRAGKAREPQLLAAAQEAARLVGLRRVPRIRVARENVCPFVFGLLRPIVVLPTELTKQVSSEELVSILSHEFAHVKRRDPLIGWVMALCEALYFFHPAFRLAKRHLLFERETACDDHVLALGKTKRGAYAQALVSAAEISLGAPSRMTPAPVLAESFDQLKRRLLLIGSAHKRRARLTKWAVVLLLVLGVLSLPGIVLTARSQEQVPDQAQAQDAKPEEGVLFKGIVTDPNGRPLSNVHVRSDVRYYSVGKVPTQGEAETSTAADGSFVLGPLPVLNKHKAGRTLVFDHPDYAIAWYRFLPDDDADLENLKIKLLPPMAVAGRITDEAGKPVSGAIISAGLQLEYHYFSLTEENGMAATSDAEGRFRFERIPEGTRLHLSAKHIKYVTYSTREGYRQGDYPIRAGDEEVEITLEPGGSVAGRLLLDDKPYKQKDIAVVAVGANVRSYDMTDDQGRFEITGLRKGTYYVLAYHETLAGLGLVSAPRANVAVEVGAPPTSVNLTLAGGHIVRGRIRDEKTGKPITDNHIWASLKDNERVSMGEADSDDEGRFTLLLPEGDYVLSTLEWRGGSQHSVKKHVSVQAEETLGEIVFTITTRSEIWGQLVDGDDRPVEGTVRISGDTVKTRKDGTFSVPAPFGSGRSEMVLAFNREKNLGWAFYWQRSDVGKELKIQLQPVATITGRIVDENGAPVVDVPPIINIHSDKGGTFFSVANAPWQADVRPDGTFTISPIPFGLLLHFSVSKPGRYAKRSLDDLKPNEVLDLGDVILPAAKTEYNATIAGRVIDENKKPVVGAQVYTGNSRDVTDRKGRFELKNLPADRKITVNVTHQGYGWHDFRQIPTGEENAELQVFPLGYELIGKPAPALLIEQWFNTDPLVMEELRGKVVLLAFGIHVLSEQNRFPQQLQGIATKYQDRDVVVIGVHADKQQTWPSKFVPEDIAKYLEEKKLTIPLALDHVRSKALDTVPKERSGGATFATYDAKLRGTMFLIDKQGNVRCSPTHDNLDKWIKQLLDE